MLSARAYSFRQKSRLAVSLSWIGGYTNVTAFLTCGYVVSHVTGATTHLGRTLAAGNFGYAFFFAFLVLAFFCGAILSTCMTEHARRRGNPSKYVYPILTEALILSAFACAIRYRLHSDAAPTGLPYCLTGLAALAMGLQNAAITKISGGIVRTTHLTGVVTDLGIEGAQLLFWYRDRLRGRAPGRISRVVRLSRRHPTALRVALLASIFASFLAGAFAATLIFDHQPTLSIWPAVLFLLWIVYADWRSPIADIRELDPLRDSELASLGVIRSLLPPELSIYRFICRHGQSWHRAPNLQLWADRLPSRCRVAILALSPLVRLQTNTLLDLRAAVEKLRARGTIVILAGVTLPLIKNLDRSDLTKVFPPMDLCPDLEFAIARGLALAQRLKSRQASRQSPPSIAQYPSPGGPSTFPLTE